MIHTNSHFTLTVIQEVQTTKLCMEVFGDTVSTSSLPATYSLLKMHLPSILRSKCFNENNFTFAREVRSTEIGHLFEHILLEYLCMLKIAAGCTNSVHNGLTHWNWQRDPRGTFHITVDSGNEDEKYFVQALKKTVKLTSTIIQSGTSEFLPTHHSSLVLDAERLVIERG